MKDCFDVIVVGAGHAGCEGGRGAPRRAGRPVHAVDRYGRAHAVQPGDRRHGEGASGPRDRCARRVDGPGDRRDRHSIQAAQPEPRPRGVVAARAGGQEDLRALGEGRARRGSKHRMADRQGRARARRARPRARARDGRRRRVRLRLARRDDRHVSQRPRPHRARAACRRAARASRRRTISRNR